MKKAFQIGLILAATDKATSVINKAFGGMNKQLTGFEKKSAQFARGAAGVGLAAGATAAAVLTPIGLAVEKAIQFEDAMADVAKVLNLKNGSKELEAIGKAARDTSVYLAKMPTDVAKMYAELAQGGIAKKDLTEIAKLAGEVAVAFDIDAQTAGDRYVKMQNALGTSLKQTKVVFDAINSLSDKTAAKASQITDYLAAGGAGVARTLGITGQQSAALGSVFISMGKSGEESATIFERMTKGMMNMNKAAGKTYSAAGGGMAGLMAVIEKGKGLQGQARFEFFRAFGEYGNDVSQLANNFELLQKHLGYVADEQQYLGSVNQEFQNRMGTTGTKLRQARAQLESLAIEAGTGLLPAIKEILVAVTPMLQSMSKWIAANPKLTAGIMKGAVAFGVFAGGLAVVAGGISAVTTIIPVAIRALALLRTGIIVVRSAMIAMGIAAAANPIGLIITAIALGALLIYKYWGPIKEFFTGLWVHINAVFTQIGDTVKNLLGNTMFEAGKNIFAELARGLFLGAGLPLKPIFWAVEKIRGMFPSSPAKWGPLSDLHKVDIMGQVARGVKAAPLRAAVTMGVNTAVRGPLGMNSPSPSPVASGGGGTVNFSPVINVTGGGAQTKMDVMQALKQYMPEFERLIQNRQRVQERAAY